jgi:ubiquinone biosynthesis protein
MTTFQSIRLIRELYFKKGLPDINLIQSFGLLAVKIGQIHALRLDFLPAEKCEELSKLYRKNNPISEEEIEKLIESLGGDEFRQNFQNIEKMPIATASVGQVYRGTLKNGDRVVIKFIKSKFKERFLRDVANLKRFLKTVLFLYPKLRGVGDPMGILDDVATYTLAELDLRNEVKGNTVLQKIFLDYKDKFDLSSLSFVKQYPELSGENIMVSEYKDCPSVDELLELGKFTYEDMLKLFHIQGFYIFKIGTFHGDVHPGNILYDGERFYFVDTGFIGQVNDRMRKGLFFFFEALSRYDYPECAKWLNEMAEVRLSGQKFELFKENFLELYKDFTNSTVSQVSLTRQMMLTIKLGVNSGMKFDKGIFSIIRSMMYLDGMVLKCNPNAVLLKDMRRFIDTYRMEV